MSFISSCFCSNRPLVKSSQRFMQRMANTTIAPESALEHDSRVGWVYDAGMEAHMGDELHVECPKRITTIREAMERQGLSQRCFRIPSKQATDTELLRCHPQSHLEHIDNIYDQAIEAGGTPNPRYHDGRLTYDGHVDLHDSSIYANKETARAARLAAGCVVQATRSVVNREVDSALAVVRPPGHHAECARAMGFCFFCNCAVAARDAIAASNGAMRKVLVLDWDVHHGNGIQDCLYEDPNILFISIHRDPSKFYPFVAGFVNECGKDEGAGFNINVPWATRGSGDLDYQAAFETIIEPVIKSFSPDLIIVAAGFDAAEGDPLGGCLLTPSGYAWMTRRLRGLCHRIVLALEGGYNNRVTADCVCACLRALLGETEYSDKPAKGDAAASGGDHEEEEEVEDLFAAQAKKKSPHPLPPTLTVLRKVYEVQSRHWPVLEGFDERWEAMIQRQRRPDDKRVKDEAEKLEAMMKGLKVKEANAIEHEQ